MRLSTRSLSVLALLAFAWVGLPTQARAQETAAPLRIICFGAHPDDAEFKAGGVAIKWAKLGHKVKFVSVTNGDIGHWRESGAELARRRTAEVKAAAKVLGIESEVLDIHDGELEPTLENRRTITRLIRNWQADLVMSHRPNDYHPDHRYTGILVQDAAFMVTVPGFCPDTPILKNNPVFMFYSDRFQRPNPFTPDVSVAIDDVFEQKLDAVDKLVSQVYEGGANGSAELAREVPADPAARRAWLGERQAGRYGRDADKYRQSLIDWYGEAGKTAKYAESFEVCEYGKQANRAELMRLFPFLPKGK
jgi:LmbE family N-acetylglucosaminyl deacetylase